MGRRIQLITLGCSKNRVDSEHILKHIDSGGIEILTSDAITEESGVDTVIINTCGFIKDAKEESLEAIFNAVEAKSRGYIKQLFVFGCLSQRYRAELKSEIPEVDGFFGAFDSKSVVEALGLKWDNRLNNMRYLTTPSHYAYLKISEGCDRVCSYCSIPLIRGGHKSETIENLVEEAEHLAKEGIKELIIVAQDTTYYGLDLYKKRSLAPLLEKLALVNGIEWIRLLYSYPASFPLDVLDVMAENNKICRYLDIPLQHINDSVLSKMRRNINGEETRRVIDGIRERVPDIVLRTTMIVGHPGETEKAFKELLDFVESTRFQRLGAFTYSEEEGTWGAMNLKDRVSEKVKQERYLKLMEVQSAVSYSYNQSRKGTFERVIIDSVNDGVVVGRSSGESPEVDGEIIITSDSLKTGFKPKEIIGTFANVLIEKADEYDLYARVV